MSVKELKFITQDSELNIEQVLETYRFKLIETCSGMAVIYLDRNQAHLLKLWLEEHLKIDDKELEQAKDVMYQEWRKKTGLW